MMKLPSLSFPGLYRTEIISGIPPFLSRNGIWLMSSRLMIASNSRAFRNSMAGVSLDENMMSSPRIPALSARTNSGNELQSAPNPSLFRIFSRNGLGFAFTAKYSLYPGFHSKAFNRRRAFFRLKFDLL